MPVPVTDIGSLIVTTPGVNGGKPRVAGVGVSVHQLATLFNEGASPEEIAERYEGLTVGLVYAALAHYFVNKQQVDEEIEDEYLLYKELAAKYPDGDPPLPRRRQ